MTMLFNSHKLPKPPAPQPATRVISATLVCLLVLLTVSCSHSQPAPAHGTGPTTISIGTKVIRSGVRRFGMNLSGQTFYDSGQMMRDLTFRNPGFEGEIWQTILQCKVVKGDSCADNDEWSGWPADFAKGARFEFFYGAAKGQSGVVSGSTVAAGSAHQGVWVSFSGLSVHPQVGDFYILRMKFPGEASAGWRLDQGGGGKIDTEFHDISSSSPGKQALRLEASGPGQWASVISDVDTWEGRSFVQLKGTYTFSFRAKGIGGNNSLTASVARLAGAHGNMTYFTRPIQLTPSWKDFQFTFGAHEDGTFIGPILVTFAARGGSVLLDDASLVESANPDNPTAFRNAVVDRLRELHPGNLRYMDNGGTFGSTIDNLIAPPFARQRAGYSEGNKDQDNIAVGLHEFLVLCKAVQAEPWFVVPMVTSPAEMRNLIEYLAGAPTTPYGQKRAALGQSSPWTDVFPQIHLELGNETWNWGSFPGEGIPDPKAYATRVSEVFGAARTAPYFVASKFDLIMDGWFAVPWWTEQELSVKSYADTIDIAPYTFNGFNDASTPEAIFGPMFAEPEALDSRPSGIVATDSKLAAKYGVKLGVYEVNLGTTDGKAPASAVDAAIPSVGAGISTADHMLLMLRDDGVINQAFFCLPEYANGFKNPDQPGARLFVKLWGSVVDMGGQTNRVRPSFLAEELANSAIAGKMVETTVTGNDPTWDQPESPNGKIKLNGAHLLQSFAFTDGSHVNLVLFNLSRNAPLPILFSGPSGPHGDVRLSLLTSPKITDGNESTQTVAIKHDTLHNLNPASPYTLPPYSMTVLSWDISGVHY